MSDVASRRGARLMVFTGHYPSPYKPYYDTQLIDLLAAGYQVDVIAAPPLDDTGHEKAAEHGVLAHVHYYPGELRRTPVATYARALTRASDSARFMNALNGAPLRRKVGDLTRMLSLPAGRPDAILVHGLGVAITFAWLRRWYPDVPMAMYYHGGEVASVEAHQNERAARAFAMFDVVFTNTEFSRRQAIERGCPAERIRVLPVGFSLDDYQPGARAYRAAGVLRLLSLGRLSQEKGLDDLIAALDQVVRSGRSAIELSIVGDGYLRGRLEDMVTALGLHAHVHFLGALPNSRVAGLLARTDALVLSSYAHGSWAETQACAVQEAMLMKALVVTTRTGGVPESVPAVMHGLAVAERDVSGLSRAISAVYDMTDTELAELGAAGRGFVETRYDIRTLNQELLTELWACSRPD